MNSNKFEIDNNDINNFLSIKDKIENLNNFKKPDFFFLLGKICLNKFKFKLGIIIIFLIIIIIIIILL
jgi:hypothetical protein